MEFRSVVFRSIYTSEAQDLIAMNYQNNEILIPVSDEIVKTINREKEELYTNLPEGLLEIYLSDDDDTPNDSDEEL